MKVFVYDERGAWCEVRGVWKNKRWFGVKGKDKIKIITEIRKDGNTAI